MGPGLSWEPEVALAAVSELTGAERGGFGVTKGERMWCHGLQRHLPTQGPQVIPPWNSGPAGGLRAAHEGPGSPRGVWEVKWASAPLRSQARGPATPYPAAPGAPPPTLHRTRSHRPRDRGTGKHGGGGVASHTSPTALTTAPAGEQPTLQRSKRLREGGDWPRVTQLTPQSQGEGL